MGHVLVVPLPACDWIDGLTAELSLIARQVALVRAVDDAAKAWSSRAFSAVVFAGDPEPSLPPAISSLLDVAAPHALVVVPDGASLDWSWLDFAAEVMLWPSQPNELRFRLDRLTNPSHRTNESDCRDDAVLSAMLAKSQLVGQSRAFRQALSALTKIVQCGANVLISGETGTGKDIVARAIHYLGARSGEPFIPVNCGALPETLFENELFGHARGAYTTAVNAQVGLVAQAHRGTLFLDEIDTLAPRSQAALLRFLQDGGYRPLGASSVRASDVRVIAATNTDIAALVGAGGFREDLYYRLNVLQLRLPPLRERTEDIPLLAEHILARMAAEHRCGRKRFSASARAWMLANPWHGNVRELENWVQRQYLLCEGDCIDADEAPAAPEPAASFRIAKRRAIDDFERGFLSNLIADTGGNVSAASRLCATERRALGRLLRKHGIDPAAYRGSETSL